jgi:hypothetical protein
MKNSLNSNMVTIILPDGILSVASLVITIISVVVT